MCKTEHCSEKFILWSRDSSVGIATRYGLDGLGSNPSGGGGARFSGLVHTGYEGYPASYTTGTGSLSRGLSGRGLALTTHPHLAPRLKKE
jgi:hypothetical protein